MLVAKYWAEARQQHHFPRRGNDPRQITIRRFGWSNDSQEAAEAHAQQRVEQAMEAVLNNPEQLSSVLRREPKVAYNGADGIPIREEIVEMQGDTVITRNSYGALCLNTPDVMFLDLDDDYRASQRIRFNILFKLWLALSIILTIPLFLSIPSLTKYGTIFILLSAAMLGMLLAGIITKILLSLYDITYKIVSPPIKQIETFAQTHPQWMMNLYRTPAGYRLLVLHQKFNPADDSVWAELKTLNIDPMYQRMCQLQKCFRARVSPKPWRMGIAQKINGYSRRAWNVQQAQDPARIQWITDYNNQAQHYASCHLIKQFGENKDHFSFDTTIQHVLQQHDQLSKAQTDLPLA